MARTKTIKTRTIWGDILIKAKVRRWTAVNRTIKNGQLFWVVTYVPEGITFPGYFFSKKDAIRVAKLARRTFPYPITQTCQVSNAQWLEKLEENNIQFIA